MGYLLIDDSVSGGKKFETDTTWCRHCQAVIDERKWKRDGGVWKCSGCAGPVCNVCVTNRDSGNNLVCAPWKKTLDNEIKNIERRNQFLGTTSFTSGGIII
jgi:hypothetical protein